jgi:hypothetical protein
MIRIWTITALTLLAAVLVACNNQTAPNQVERSSITSVATPEVGKGTVIGQIISTETGEPLTNTIVRLPEVYREGEEMAFALDGANSPGAITDEMGMFAMSNIEAREYVLMIGDIYGVHVVVPEPDNSDKARVWKLPEGEILDLGEIRVDL